MFLFGAIAAWGETVTLGGTDYECQRLIDREIGPGIRHMRFRLPTYPLNINILQVDLNNPYNGIETTVANESSRGTEGLVHAAERQSRPGHVAVGGANANFWIVASQPEENVYKGITRNASVRNGVIVTESNQHRDQWDGGTMRTGVVSLSTDRTAYVDYCTSTIKVSGPNMPAREIHQVNKGIHPDELAMYNSFYGANTAFLPICQDAAGKYQHDAGGDATEVILDFCEGSGWGSNTDIAMVVREVRTNAGKGTLGNHDAALVGRADNATALAGLSVGDVVTIKYSWTYNPGSADEVSPVVEQAVGGNALVMRGGELTAHNENETYNSQVYSRTGYGCSPDGKTVYIIVIDKSTDPVYGASKGCNTAKMCEFARWLGCSHMANFDAGGSAEMFINGKIENRTTEGNPRAVANGWLVYDVSPVGDDATTVARLAFDAPVLEAPIYGSFSPKIIAYNAYGSVVSYDYTDVNLSVSDDAGRCEGNMFYAGGTPCHATLTATTADGLSVSKAIEVRSAELSLRVKNLLIDGTREYPLEVVSTIGDTEYAYDPSLLTWHVENPDVAVIDEAGVLHGVSEGTTTYTCSIGDFSDQATVTVEIAPAAEIGLDNWAGWKAKGASGIADVSFTESGTLSFNYSAARDPYVTITKQVDFYSIPDAVVLEFRTSVPLRNVTADLRAPMHTRSNNVVATNNGGEFAANTDYVIEFPLDQVGDPADLAIYPLSLRSLRFNVVASNDNRGRHTVEVGRLYARYNNHSGVEDIVVEEGTTARISPNPVAAGSAVTVSAVDLERVEIYSAAGICLESIRANGIDSLGFNAPAVPGVYIVRVVAGGNVNSSLIIVK